MKPCQFYFVKGKRYYKNNMHDIMKKRMHIISLVFGESVWGWSGKNNINPLNFVSYVCTTYEIDKID